MAIDGRQIKWALQRMSRIIKAWRKIDHIDRLFLFRKFRDEYPQEFWEAANEKLGKG